MSRLVLLLLTLTIIGCGVKKNSLIQKTDDSAASAEWQYLFDGTSVDGWKNYNSDELSPQWVVKDGELSFDTEMKVEAERKGGGDIIYSTEEFENFELYWEWKLPTGGNSGLFYHVKEGYGSPSSISPEYQMLDDLKWEEINDAKLGDWQKTGADYAMYSADESKKKVKPAGEWNTSRIIFTPQRVQYFLNGQQTVEFVPWSDDWKERKMKGKWKDAPDYGKFKKGYIAFQDHDSPLWLREVKIRKL